MRIACYMEKSPSKWIQVAWEREKSKEYVSVKRETQDFMNDIGYPIVLEDGEITVKGDQLEGSWKQCWQKVKVIIKKETEKKIIEEYKQKPMQSSCYINQEPECHMWLRTNMDPKKTAAIINMQEQMVETRAWKACRGLTNGESKCRLCGSFKETVSHLLAGCKILAGTEYLKRHNNALMILAVEWAKQHQLVSDETIWYKEKWTKGHMIENQQAKLIWDFEYSLNKQTSARRPDLTLEEKQSKQIWICDMSCPMEENINKKISEKLIKYQQLVFETREKRPDYQITVVPLVIGCMGGGGQKLIAAVKKLIDESSVLRVVSQMQKTVLMESETTLRKIMSGIIQTDAF